MRVRGHQGRCESCLLSNLLTALPTCQAPLPAARSPTTEGPPLVSAEMVALGCRDGGPAVSNGQGRSRQGGNHASVSCPHPYSHPQKSPAFIILKLLAKPLLSKVPTALSLLLLLFLPRRDEGLQVDRTSLLPSRSQGRQACIPRCRESQRRAWSPAPVAGSSPQQHAAGLAAPEGQLHLLQNWTEQPGHAQHLQDSSPLWPNNSQQPHCLGAASTPSPTPRQERCRVPHQLPAWSGDVLKHFGVN